MRGTKALGQRGFLTVALFLGVALGVCSSPRSADLGEACGSVEGKTPADDGWQVMFRSVAGRLPVCDQQAIYVMMGLASGDDGKELLVAGGEVGGPVSIKAYLEDLNGNGQDEVFLVGGNAYLSGGTGSSVWLFIKPGIGEEWQMNLGFPAATYRLLPEGSGGFPDLQFAGMGWCEGVWRWNGRAYEHSRNVPTAPGGCENVGGG